MASNPPLFTRSDTLLGICQGIGEDVGISPTVLRVIIAALVLWSPTAAIGAYLLLGVVLAATRWLMPVRGPLSPNS